MTTGPFHSLTTMSSEDATPNATPRRLLIVNQTVGYLYVDLANAALEHYAEVCLLTGSLVELGSRLDPRITVRKIARYRKGSVLGRLWSWMISFVQIVVLIRLRYRHYDIIAASNPPLSTWLPLFSPNRIGLHVLDLYPEALYKTEMVSAGNLIVRIWARINRATYPRFTSIWALTPSMTRMIGEKYDCRVTHVPAWASRLASPQASDYLKRLGLLNKWIVLYSGNLGREHDIEALVECAAKLQECEGLVFVIAGQGWKREALERTVKERQLGNVCLLPKLAEDDFSALLNHARLGVVTQSLRTADVCIPSKTFNLLSAGLPILGIGDPESDFGYLVRDHKVGAVYKPHDTVGMGQFITSCWQDPKIGRALRMQVATAAAQFTTENARRIVQSFVRENGNP